MKTVRHLSAILLMASACTPLVSRDALAPLDGALKAVEADVAMTVDAAARAEAEARKAAAIRAGRPHFRLLPGCAAQDITLIGAPMTPEDKALFICAIEEVGNTTRSPNDAEVAGRVLRLLSAYVSELDALARSDLPEQVAEAGAGLLNSTAELAGAARVDVSGNWALANPSVLSRFSRFGLEQYRARVLRQVVRNARAPVEQAVRLIVAYLLEEDRARDPVVRTSAALLQADEAMQGNPGSAAAVAAFEAAFAANETARAASPSVRLMRVLAAHNALADRLAGPPSVEELTALVKELTELRRLIDTN